MAGGLTRGAKPPWERRQASAVTAADVAAVQTQVTVVSEKFPITEPDIATDAVTTTKIADNAVTQPKAATGVVDGDTITGPVIQTSAPGVGHTTIMLDGPNNLQKFYAGFSGETAGTIDPTGIGIGSRPQITISSGTTPTAATGAYIALASGTTTTANALLGAGTSAVSVTQVDGTTVIGNLNATMGTGGVGTGTFRDSVDARVVAAVGAWQTVSYNANWADVGGGFVAFRYRKSGTKVILQGYPTRNTSSSGASAVIGTLPSGYRPTASVLVGTFTNNGGTYGLNQVYVTSGGAITVTTSATAGTALWVEGEFFTD